jgi:hypothetical protein
MKLFMQSFFIPLSVSVLGGLILAVLVAIFVPPSSINGSDSPTNEPQILTQAQPQSEIMAPAGNSALKVTSAIEEGNDIEWSSGHEEEPQTRVNKQDEADGKTLLGRDIFASVKHENDWHVLEYPENGTFQMQGNSYSNGLVFITSGWGNYAIYELSDSFNYMSGILGFVDHEKIDMSGNIKIYGDGELLATLMPIFEKPSMAFSVNISGVKTLKIEANEYKSGSIALTNVVFTNEKMDAIPNMKQYNNTAIIGTDIFAYNLYGMIELPASGGHIEIGGKSYYNAICSPSGINSDIIYTAFYNTNGQFSNVSGLCGYADNSHFENDRDMTHNIKIYGDGVLLTEINSNVLKESARSFSLDVQGIEILKIEVHFSKWHGFNKTLALVDVVFSR